MSPQTAAVERKRDWVALASILAIAVVGAFALYQSWGRWLHPIIDAGRDLYLPEQIRHGMKLYRDAAYFYPPFAAYALALLTGVFGASLSAYVAIGIGLASIVAATMFTTARARSGALAGLTAGLLFVSVCMVGAAAYGSNFIFPYSHNAVFGMTLFLLFERVILKTFVEGVTRSRTLAAILLGALCSLTKIEFALFVVATVVVAAAVAWVTRQVELGAALRAVALGLSGVGSCWIFSWAYFLDAGRLGSLFITDVFPSSLLSGPVARAFYAKVSGTDQLANNIVLAVVGALAVAVYIVALRLLDASVAAERPFVRRVATTLVLAAIGGTAWYLGSDLFFRAWTILQVALVPLAIRDLARLRNDPKEVQLAVMPLLLWFSLCASSRIWFNLVPAWYGFFLTLPVILLIVHILFRYLPDKGVYSSTAAVMWLPLFLIIGGRNLAEQRAIYAEKIFPIESPRGSILDYSAERASVLNDFLRYAEVSKLPDLVMIPEGLAVNYLASIPNPIRYHTFTPAEMPTPASETRIIEEFERGKPQFVALTNQEAAAFGALHFGKDYGTELLRYLRDNYTVEKEWRTSTFSMTLIRRIEVKDSPDNP